MCPSYMATGEEMHSTRGRARLLFEMLRGETLTGGWREASVHQALDLCLSCKGCKGECPVKVDMATYKAEFMSHYYAGRLRPRHAYASGLIDRWARAASHAPALVNFLTQREPFAGAARRFAQVAPQRRVPPIAAQSFTRAFAARRSASNAGPQVILWPDTFTNYFHPDVAHAAVEVLERAGWHVRIPPVPLCCGRALYEFGFLDRARAYLKRVMAVLDADIRAGTPIVGLEPACVSVFREELPNLFANDAQAKRLSRQVHLLSELLDRQGEAFQPPPLQRRAVMQAHCHHKAVLKTDAQLRVLHKLGVDVEMLDSGCCGMAGSFGFERDKYEVSMRCAERVLLPAVRTAGEDTLILADGFSCREQIVQCTGRRALHIAQVLREAYLRA
jgi:Fe-S oxidoreductase